MKICLANVAVGHKGDAFVECSDGHLEAELQSGETGGHRDRFPLLDLGHPGNGRVLFSHNIDTLNAPIVYHSAVSAERDGFDGVLITCFGDPMLQQIRQAVNIPVASIGESAMLMASTMGEQVRDHSHLRLQHPGNSPHRRRVRPLGAVGQHPLHRRVFAEQGGAIFNATDSIENSKKLRAS